MPRKSKQSNREYYQNNRWRWFTPKALSVRRTYRRSKRGKMMSKNWYTTNKRRVKRLQLNGHLQRTYGISLAGYTAMYKKQGGRCAICRKYFSKLCIDHSHSTKKIRGLLCYKCNTGLGQLSDSIEMLTRAIKYLKRKGA